MYYTNEEVTSILEVLTKKSLAELGISESKEKYLSTVDPTDVDNVHNALNIWCALYEDMVGYSGSFLVDYIHRKDLVSVITEAKRLRLAFIQSNLDYGIFLPGTPWFFFRGTMGKRCPAEQVLFVLGFPKRLYLRAANLEKAAFDKVRKINKEFSGYPIPAPNKSWEFSDYHYHPISLINSTDKVCSEYHTHDFVNHNKLYVLYLVRKFTRELLPSGDIRSLMNTFILPPGATYELSGDQKTYYNKFMTLSQNRDYVNKFLQLPEHYYADCPAYNTITNTGKLISVPKDITSFRTVLPEEVARQVIGYAYADAITKSLAKSKYSMNYYPLVKDQIPDQYPESLYKFGVIDTAHQDRNQLAARIGSITNMLATMDYTQASDSISCKLLRILLPEDHYDLIMEIRANKIQLDNTTINSNLAFTMGFAVTFIMESVIFTAAARAAVILSWGFAPEKDRKFFKRIDRALASCFSYGDDVIIPSFAADALRLVSDHLGFKLNTDKSYWDSPYRESCGCEFYNGIDISTHYFPRGTSTTRLAELIGLQHKLYPYGLTNAFIIHKCTSYRAHLTENVIDSRYMDIWTWDEPQCQFHSPYLSDISAIRTESGQFWYLISASDGLRISNISSDKLLRGPALSALLNKGSTPISGIWRHPYTDLHGLIHYYWKVEFLSRNNVVALSSIHPLEGKCNWNPFYRITWSEYDRDEEPYRLVTVPTVTYTTTRSKVAWDNSERLAYVMSLAEMAKRKPMSTSDYLDFMVDRANGSSIRYNDWGNTSGIIDYNDLRKSLTCNSAIKLIRKLVPALD